MGLFSKLFGSSGSDKADRMRQQAIDAFKSIKTPQLADLQVQLDKQVSAGVLTPAQAEAQLLTSNAFNDIVTDPSLTGAAKQALSQLQQIGTEGGLTAIDKAKIQDITNETNQLAKSRNESILQNARERGIGGSGLEMANRLQNEQSAADRAAMAGTQVAANAEQRALDAIKAAGGLGQSLQAQEYGQEANKAQAQNAIDLFNTQNANATNLYNVGTANQAQAANLTNAQNIANANTAIANANKTYNAQQNQQLFNNEMAKASGIAGTYNNWANDATKQAQNEQGADMALLGGALKGGAMAGGFMLGGPAGAAVAPGVMGIGGGKTTNKNYSEDMLPGFSEGGEVHPNENSAMSPEHAEPENRYSHQCFSEFCMHPEHESKIQPPFNTNEALTHAEAEPENKSLEDAYNDFVKTYCYGGSVKMADGGMVTIKAANNAANKEPRHMTPYHAEGYETGGVVESTSTAKAPEEPKKKEEPKKEEKNIIQKLGDLIGSHGELAGQVDKPYDFRSGGRVPGVPKVPGDSPKNDIVPAKLSPGEIVLPRSVAQHPAAVPNFVQRTLSREDPTSVALKRLRQAHLNQGA